MDGITGGRFAGRNWQIGSLVLGVEGELVQQLGRSPRPSEIAEWLASFGPLRPSSGLVFVPMIARTARVFPALGLEDVDGVLDLFAGLPGWRFRPRTAEYWRRR